MGKPGVVKSKETNKQIDSDTKCNPKQQTADKGNERPEWLPDGWDIEVRTRKSGPNVGSPYKCYIDPSNQYKFYSKPEVLRHLETRKDNNCSSKKKKSTSMHSPSTEEEKCTNKHSPSKEEKKCIDKHSPSNEDEKSTKKHSPSKEEEKPSNTHSLSKEEEKYIDMHSQSKDREKSINMHSPTNVAGEKSTVEDLPPGWISEVKIRKIRNGIKKDLFYTDPASGYVFRSKKDVLRYLETGDIGKCAIKPSRRQYQDEDNLTPSPAAKRHKPKESTPKQNIFVAKELVESLESPVVNNSKKRQDVNVTSGKMVAPDTSGGSVVKMHLLEDMAASSPEMKKTSEAVLKHESLRVNHSNHSISKNDFNVGRRFSPRLGGVEPVKLADSVINDQTLLVPKRNLRKNRTSVGADMETISSQHFNGLPEIEQPKAMMNTGSILSEVVFKEQPCQLERDKTENHKPEILANSNKSSKKKEPSIPRRASKRLAGSKEVIAELQQSEGGPVTEITDNAPLNGESGNKRRKSSKKPTTADNQQKKLEVDDEKSEPQLSFAFHYSWSDPCLDNAINTLTSVLPPVENLVLNGSSTAAETDIQNPPLNTVTGRSRRSQNNSVDNGPTTFHEETDIQKTLFDNVIGISKDSQKNLLDNVTRSRDKNPLVQSNKSKRKKEVKVPMRLSKRLAGLEPEAKPSDKPLEYSSKKSCKEEPTATVLLTNESSNHFYDEVETKFSHRVSDGLKTEVLGESPRKIGQSYDAQTVRKEQQMEKAEAKNISNDRSEAEATAPFSESWSDPCLEFAFKTLTGALPVASAAETFKERTPDVDDPPNNELYVKLTTSIDWKAHDNSDQFQNKNECNMDSQSSKLLLGKPESKTSFTSNKDHDNSDQFQTKNECNMDSQSSKLLLGKPESRTSFTSDKDHDNSNQFQNKNECNMDSQSSKLLLGKPELRTSFTSDKDHDNSNQFQNKSEGNMDSQSSKLLLGKPESRTSFTYDKDVPKFTYGESHCHESDLIRELFGETLYVEDESSTQLLHHSGTNANSQIYEDPLKNNGQVAEGEFGTMEQPPPLPTETLNHENSELQFCDSFMKSYPCLEFAFKTLTGVMPVEDDLANQGGIKEPAANCHEGRDGGPTFLDFGSSSFSQSDFSFNFDSAVKSTPGQQSSMSSSFPSPSLQSCPRVDPQQQYSQRNNNSQRR